VESLDQGLRGRFTTVSGRLIADTPADLGAMEQAFRSYNDGLTGTLVDNFGVAWDEVKLESYEPQGRVLCLAHNGAATRSYVARFQHLI